MATSPIVHVRRRKKINKSSNVETPQPLLTEHRDHLSFTEDMKAQEELGDKEERRGRVREITFEVERLSKILKDIFLYYHADVEVYKIFFK